MRFKKITKLLLGVFIVSALFNGYESRLNSEYPPLIVQDAYIDSHLI